MSGNSIRLAAALLGAGLSPMLAAAPVVPTGYVYLTPPTSGTYAYPDTGNTELTDGVIPSVGWGSGITATEAEQYVGWLSDDPVVQFDFGGPVVIDSLVLWVDDANGAAGVRLPLQVDIAMGGTTVTRPIDNPATAVPLGVVFDNLGLSGSSLTLTVTSAGAGRWTMISEVEFAASTVPATGAGWLLLAGLGGLGWGARRGRCASAPA